MSQWQTPKTDWVSNPKNPVAEDFNRIEGNIDFLKQDIETKKGAIVNALNTIGLETEITETHSQIANKIIAANQGTKIITPGTSNITIPKGFHSGQGYVIGDPNLVASNIKKGISIFGVNGTHVTDNIVKSIQVGEATDDNDITISRVDPSKTIVFLEMIRSKEDHLMYFPGIVLKNSTTISVRRTELSVIDYEHYAWKVIEFNPDIVKSVQRGIYRYPIPDAPGLYTANIPINNVNRSKTICIVQGTLYALTYTPSYGDYGRIIGGYGVLTSNTNLRLYCRADGQGWTTSPKYTAFLSWQLIEFV